MAEQIVSSATSAVTSELARILFSGLVGRLDNRQAAAAADKKLRRLELLLIKIHSAVEASEKHPIENAWLVKWRDKFKEAAAEGDEVLASFRQPAMNNSAPAAAGEDADHHQQEHSSSAASAPAPTTGASSSARNNAPSGMAHGIRGASSEDIERLNSAVEKLEELSPEIGDFIKLLKVEVLALKSKSTERTMATKRKRKPVPGAASATWRTASAPGFLLARVGNMKGSACRMSMNMVDASEKKPTATQGEEEERNTLSDRLEKAYATICRNVELADGRDLRGHEWLAYWASILREAKGQGCAVLGAISPRREEVAECDGDREEDSELSRFVCGMESLAGEADYFAGLACVCPSY